ncbi:MAG: hypothetical protein ICV77_13075 [Cyanobacteria bacterium Co-bin8]|nr:hypothetical protein [Cyanobacteria bacterium Co-bin8]
MAATTGTIWADEAFMALPQDGHRYELVQVNLEVCRLSDAYCCRSL